MAHALAAVRCTFRKPKLVTGSRLTFRDATPEDAAFILSLRLDPAKNKHLSPVPPDLGKQREWLERYGTDDSQIYFIIEHESRPVGTVRLYDQRGTSFCWGSWILANDRPEHSAVESALMVYAVALELGFTASHFDVRKANQKVWQHHEREGATRVGETDLDYLYTIGASDIRAMMRRHADRFERPIRIDW
jgi:RimJ/RimL family protein N-acetyltransferase